MGCCGQGRAALRQASAQTPVQRANDPAPVAGDRSVTRVLLQYKAQTPITVRGVRTGRIYSFDAQRSQQHVEMGDAAALLTSRHFVRID